MGSIGCHRDKGMSHREFFTREYPSMEILADHTKNGVYYAAARKCNELPTGDGDGEVFALVFTFNWYRGYQNFVWKEQDETVGPCAADCPAKLLDMLTPTDSEYANDWRARCRANLAAAAAKPKVKTGDMVEFAEEIEFSNGYKGRVFRFFKRNRFTADGMLYNLGQDWKRREYQVVSV